MIDALNIIASEFPTQPLSQSTKEHPLLHSRITELQVHTLLSLRFREHEIWTRSEIHQYLSEIAKKLNATAHCIYPNRLSDPEEAYAGFTHSPYVHEPKSDDGDLY